MLALFAYSYYGLLKAIEKIFRNVKHFLFCNPFKKRLHFKNLKKNILKTILSIHGYQIAYGPFKGMQLNQCRNWSRYDLITQILGTYETHVLQKLIAFSKGKNNVFIDLGSADGYFAVGMVFSGIFGHVYAFEKDVEMQRIIKNNAQLNGCEAKMTILGEADEASLKSIISQCKEPITILIDIEGDEYDLLNPNMLSLLSDCSIICELHPWMKEDGKALQKALLSKASAFFDIELIYRESYNPNDFEELSCFNEEERLVALSEGRGPNMHWLVLTPKKN